MIAAIVVLFHPDLKMIKRVLLSLVGQVDRIFAVDNTPGTSPEVLKLIKTCDLATHIPLGENRGIATALNIGIRRSLDAGSSHVLLLDQDSIVSPGMVDALITAEAALVQAGVKVAAIGPLYIEKRTATRSYALRYGWFHVKKVRVDPAMTEPVETDWLITSGSLIRASVLREVGLMRDELFIDWVDAEWGLRSRRRGFKSFIAASALMEHSVGDASLSVLGHTINFHSLNRNCYIVRNATYMLRPKDLGWRWVTAMILRIPKHITVHSWYSQQRLKTLAKLVGAATAGARGSVGPIKEK
ncbi:MAG: glycosyltransferase family 2 protein [Terriglobales bacterium]|jgi:rhamnosyltransferase